MLITLRGPEYLPVLDRWLEDDDFLSFVSILGEILYRGDHALWAPPALLYRFSECQGLSRGQSLALLQMGKEVSMPTLPFDAVTDSLVLTGPAKPAVDPESDIRWHRRDWTWLHRKRRLDVTVLAGENARDAQWYRWLGRAWGARLRPRSPNAEDEIVLRCRGLGGQTARQEIPLAAAEGDPVLCILDSDRNHPSAELGDTARAAIKAVDALPTEHLTHIEPLRARDVENILPLSLVQLAAEGTHWLAPMATRGFFARPGVDETLAYIDLGKDQCERRLLDTPDPTTHRYRSDALTRIRQLDPNCTASSATCPRSSSEGQACGKPWTDLPASCLVVHSVGKRLLPRILDLLEAERSSPHHSQPMDSVADWLATTLPPDDPAVLTPAHLSWSWGLRIRPRLRVTPAMPADRPE